MQNYFSHSFNNRVKCGDCKRGGGGGRAKLFQNALFMHEEIMQIKLGDFLLEFGSKSF